MLSLMDQQDKGPEIPFQQILIIGEDKLSCSLSVCLARGAAACDLVHLSQARWLRSSTPAPSGCSRKIIGRNSTYIGDRSMAGY